MATSRFHVRTTRPEDFPAIERISRLIYPRDEPWTPYYLASHLAVFPEGQFVVVETASGTVVGMAATLIVAWSDYDRLDSYLDFTADGTFQNHDPAGRTLYGAEVMVDPGWRRQGIGRMLYAARRDLVRRLGLPRIRAGARLPGYERHAEAMDAETYVQKVIQGELDDPTLSFQLSEGFRVIAVVPDYYHRDPKSRDFAALIEWRNPDAPNPVGARSSESEAA